MKYCIVVALLIYFNFDSLQKLWCHNDTRALVVSDSTVVRQKVLKLKPKTNQKVVTELTRAIIKHGKKYQVDADQLIAIAWVESKLNPKAKSSTGDYGIMQVNLKMWGKKFHIKKNDLYNIDKCVEIACKIIKENRDRGHYELACYHSCTPCFKLIYAAKLEVCLAKLV